VEEENKSSDSRNGEGVEEKKEEEVKATLPIIGFSTVSLTHLVKHIVKLMSLAESSSDAAKLPFRVMLPSQLSDIISLSVIASPSIQLLTQKIFQSLLKISTPLEIFNQATTAAKATP